MKTVACVLLVRSLPNSLFVVIKPAAMLWGALQRGPRGKNMKEGLQLTSCEEQLTRKWILSRTTSAGKQTFPSWASQSTQLSQAQIYDLQELGDNSVTGYNIWVQLLNSNITNTSTKKSFF